MFRFLHTADLHLDSPLLGLSAREGAPVEALRGASRKAFDRLIELAIAEAVDFIVIAGDVYDGDWKDYSTGLFFRSRMVKLQESGIPVYMIAGNHDAASVVSKKLHLPENVTCFSSRHAQTATPEAWPVAIHGMSFPNRVVAENLVPGYPAPVPGKFNIGVLHTSLGGADGHDTYAPCSVAELTAKGYDYWALGHIHQPMVVRENPWVVFPGNIQGRHARECGPRGCRIVSVSADMQVSDCAWHVLDVARWMALALDVTGMDSLPDLLRLLRQTLAEAVASAGDRLLATRVILTGKSFLHGALCSRPDQFEAEVEACAQDFGAGRVWIERVQVATRPLQSLDELAARDPLTKVVVDAMGASLADSGPLPDCVADMLGCLPPELAASLQSQWQGGGHQAILEDACGIILDRLTGKGHEA